MAHLRGSDLVRVVARVRPLSQTEQERGDAHAVAVGSAESLTVRAPGPGGRAVPRGFTFDACFGETCSQEAFFAGSGVADLLHAAVQGYNCTCFAYGQTGSGKTHSMSGPELEAGTAGASEADGVVPRAMEHLFALVAQPPPGASVAVRASYCEIYNEQVFDLLNLQSGQLPVRWSDSKSFYVPGLILVETRTREDMAAVLEEGHRNSHSLLTVHVETESAHGETRFGKIVFVDLAGSERLKQSKAANTEETGNINRSLFALGKVISALSSDADRAASEEEHIPYRDSKLTKLLMDSLGGNSKTLMIACCSPSSAYIEETLSTLNYATRAKSIENKPVVVMDPTQRLVAELRAEVEALRQENAALRAQLGRGAAPVGPGPGPGPPAAPPPGLGTPPPGLLRPATGGAPPPGLGPGSPPPPQQQPPPQDGEWVPQSDVRRMAAAFQDELDRLRDEHEAARAAEARATASHSTAVAENEMLSRKLDHLEQIFVSKNQRTPWRATTDSDLQHENQQLRVAVQKLRGELAALRATSR